MDQSLHHSDILRILPDRRIDAHKGDFGKILMICGSRGYTGAPVLAAMGALRSGAGLVYLCVPGSIYSVVANKLNEPIVIPLPQFDGEISIIAASKIKAMLPGKTAVLIGPGLRQCAGTRNAVRTVLRHSKCPVILDADGINVLQRHKDILRDRTSPTIMTPHPGEFARIAGECFDRRTAAMQAAKDLNAIMVLKGHETVITDGYTCYINPTGNPGMAVGGSGDALAGIIASLAGQGIEPLLAAACGAWLHGAAGDVCASEMGQYGMLPSDILKVLPRLMK